MKPLSEHWNEVFATTDEKELGWYEEDYSHTMKLLDLIPDWRHAKIFVPGVGTSGLIDILLHADARLVLNDLSPEAIEQAQKKYPDSAHHIHWLCQDIARPLPADVTDVDVWLDRAVLHFLTDDDDIDGYFGNVTSALKVGGHAIFAEFSQTGAEKCAGLILHRYSAEELSERLGRSFTLVSQFDHTFINPNGDSRPYVYALFRRTQ
jgi:EEF1A lysine methyltransferase 2